MLLKKTIIWPVIWIIRTLKKTKGQKIVTEQKNSPPSNVIRAGNKFPISGDDDIGQHDSPTKIPGTQ